MTRRSDEQIADINILYLALQEVSGIKNPSRITHAWDVVIPPHSCDDPQCLLTHEGYVSLMMRDGQGLVIRIGNMGDSADVEMTPDLVSQLICALQESLSVFQGES